MYFKKTLILLLLISAVSCNNSKKNSFVLKEDLLVRIDTLKIGINNDLLPYYYITSFNKQLERFLAYNENNHTIDIFSIKEKRFLKSVKLNREGPNYIEAPNDLDMMNNGELFTIGYFDITKLNDKGEVIKRQAINSKSENEYYRKQFFYPNQDNGFEYNNKTQKFYIKNTNMEMVKGKEYYEGSKLIGSYSFLDDKSEPLNIFYPEEFSEKNFGFNDIGFFSTTDNYIYYLFSPLPYVYRYDISNEKFEKFEASISGLTSVNMVYPSIGKNSNTEKTLDSFLYNSNFGPILSNNEFVVRLYQSATPESQRNVAETNVKENYIQIFDKDINLLKTIKLDMKVTFAGVFLSDDAVYLQIPPQNEDEIMFLKISFI